MSSSCRAFRDRLIEALEPPMGRAALGELGWHEHLLACEPCRRLLAAEEALELLLGSLPQPRLPRELAERLLARLRARPQRDALDDLLERADPAIDEPALARRVLAGIAPERADRALDRMLERVPAPEPPADLAARVLARLAPARRRRAALASPRVWFAAAAAALLLAGGAWTLQAWLGDAPRQEPAPLVESDEPRAAPEADPLATPSDELLASLSVLESWDLLTSENIDVMLANLDASDELLLELAAELAPEIGPGSAPEDAPGTDATPEPAPTAERRNG